MSSGNGRNGNGGNGNGNNEFMRRMAENVTVTALNRISGAFVVPIMLVLAIGCGTLLLSVKDKLTVTSTEVSQIKADISEIQEDLESIDETVDDHDGRIEDLEEYIADTLGVDE